MLWFSFQDVRNRGQLLVCAGSITTSNFKTGLTLEIDGAPWRVVGRHTVVC